MSQLARKGRARPSHDLRRTFSTTWLEIEHLDSKFATFVGTYGNWAPNQHVIDA